MNSNNECDISEIENELTKLEEMRNKCIVEKIKKIVEKGHQFEIYLNYPVRIYGNRFVAMGSYMSIFYNDVEIAFLPIHSIYSVHDVNEREIY